jgi:hypothetical protein
MIKGTRYIGGMFGDSECLTSAQNFFVHDADVTVGLIQGDRANVGGIHGRVCTGIFYVGYNDPTGAYNRDYFVRVNVGKMAGGYAVGGLVGENQATSHNSPLYIKDGPSTTNKNYTTKYYTQVIVNIQDWANTKTAEWFGEDDSPRNYGGTFGNILGLMHGDLFIDELWDVAPQPGQETKATRFTDNGKTKQTYLIVYENLTSAKKAEVLFWIHNDQLHNVGLENGVPVLWQQYYWGDGNGYLGWNATQQYYIDDVIQRGEQLDMGPFRWGHNCFLKYVDDASADAGYDAKSYQGAITKLQFYN